MKYTYNEIREILFDEKQTRPILLDNGEGMMLTFQQIFAIERGGKLYCILRPQTDVEELDSRSALAFSVDGEGVFRAVKDKNLSKSIFAEYYKSL